MATTILPGATWQQRRAAHEQRVDAWLVPHLERRRNGAAHPVHDFLFTYYSHRPTALRRWHPGYGVALLDAPEYAGLRGYHCPEGEPVGTTTVSSDHLLSRRSLLEATSRLLVATAGRAPSLRCFGLHEWAMVHRTGSSGGRTRHAWPLRLGAAGTDRVVDSHRIACTHFDAFRFFTPSARPLNVLQPEAGNRPELEQPGCLHAGMDLYKHAFRLSPLVASELVADCFALARDIRELDMRASPYDLSGLGFAPVRIETAEGKQEYVAAQRDFVQRAAPLRELLIDECRRLLSACAIAQPREPSR